MLCTPSVKLGWDKVAISQSCDLLMTGSFIYGRKTSVLRWMLSGALGSRIFPVILTKKWACWRWVGGGGGGAVLWRLTGTCGQVPCGQHAQLILFHPGTGHFFPPRQAGLRTWRLVAIYRCRDARVSGGCLDASGVPHHFHLALSLLHSVPGSVFLFLFSLFLSKHNSIFTSFSHHHLIVYY